MSKEPMPCAWWLREMSPDMQTPDVTIKLYRQLSGEYAHVVVMRGDAYRLNRHTGAFDYQPLPSSRSDKWIADHTFASFNEAVDAGRAAIAREAAK